MRVLAGATEAAVDDEGSLLARHAGGDPSAFAALLASWRRPVFAYLVRCGVDPATRDDLFQDIFLKVHRAAASYQPGRPLKAWLFTIVANTVRSHFRARPAKEQPIALEAVLEPRDAAASAEQVASARETIAWLEQEIGGLPLAQREVLVLTCLEGLDQNQVGAALGIPVNTVKTHLRRARLSLARELALRNAAASGTQGEP